MGDVRMPDVPDRQDWVFSAVDLQDVGYGDGISDYIKKRWSMLQHNRSRSFDLRLDHH
jgi:hypothetical protein